MKWIQSPISAISSDYYSKYFAHALKIKKTPRVFRSYTGDSILPLGTLNVNVEFKNKKNILELFVLPGTSTPIIGRDWLSLLKIVDNNKLDKCVSVNKIEEIQSKILKEFDDVFSNELGTYIKKKCKLYLNDNAQPVVKRPRPLPYAIRGKVEAELERLVKEGLLTPVESSS